MNFIPKTFLINNIYLPFYESPKIVIFTIGDQLKLETGINQVKSVISIQENDKQVIPFLDISKYDSESRDWFWYDTDGFPMRSYIDGENYCLTSLYPVSNYYNKIITINNLSLKKDTTASSKNLGWYSFIKTIDGVDVIDQELKVYTGSPIILSIDDNIATDRTDYYNYNNDISLTEFKVDGNIEFYYNTLLNRIYTNQDLTGAKIELYFFRSEQIVKVKSVLSSNIGMDSYITPTVDYYISKLHGQYLKG